MLQLSQLISYLSSTDISLTQVVNTVPTKEFETLKRFAESPGSSPKCNCIIVSKNSCSSVKDLKFTFLSYLGDDKSPDVFDGPFP